MFSSLFKAILKPFWGYERSLINDGQFSKNEFDVWASYNFTKQLSGTLGFAVTNEDKKDGSVPDLTQINATLIYKF